MKPSAILQQHRRELLRLAMQHHVTNMRVFGSVLHGDDTENSDLDLLVDPTDCTTLFDIAALQVAAEQLIGITVDILTPNALPDSFRSHVLAEAQAL